MLKPNTLTIGTITLTGSIILSWLWFEDHFMVRADAEIVHNTIMESMNNLETVIKKSIKVTKLNLKIDIDNGKMNTIEQDGISDIEQRKYDLLKSSVESMTQQLMEIDQ